MVTIGDTTIIQGSRGAFVNREALEHQMVAVRVPQVYVAFRAYLSRAATTRRLCRLQDDLPVLVQLLRVIGLLDALAAHNVLL